MKEWIIKEREIKAKLEKEKAEREAKEKEEKEEVRSFLLTLDFHVILMKFILFFCRRRGRLSARLLR